MPEKMDIEKLRQKIFYYDNDGTTQKISSTCWKILETQIRFQGEKFRDFKDYPFDTCAMSLENKKMQESMNSFLVWEDKQITIFNMFSWKIMRTKKGLRVITEMKFTDDFYNFIQKELKSC